MKPTINYIINPFECPKVEEYNVWKATRIQLIESLGLQLVQLSESELVALFNEWMALLNLRMQFQSQKAQMSCLLVISLLFYFKRNSLEIASYHEYVNSTISSPIEDVVRASGKTIFWMTEDFSVNQMYLRDLMDKATEWLDRDQGQLYNALEILRQMGKKHSVHVINNVMRYLAVLLDTVRSGTKSLSILATKVIQVHISENHTDVGASFAWTVYFSCLSAMSDFKQPGSLQHLKICQTIYDSFPQFVEIPKLIPMLISGLVFSDLEIVSVSAQFTLKLVKEAPQYFNANYCEHIFAAIQTQLLRVVDNDIIFDLLTEMMHCFPPKLIPFEILQSTAIMIINNPNLYHQHNSAYKLLCQITSAYPSSFIPRDFFLDRKPAVGFIRLARLVREPIKELYPKIVQWFEEGISPQANEALVIVALNIIFYFRFILSQSDDEIYQIIERFLSSPTIKVKKAAAKALTVLRTWKALSTAVKIAFYERSGKVRRYVLKLLTMEHMTSHIELTAQILVDPSVNVRKQGIDLVNTAIVASPTYVVPLLTVMLNDFIAENISPQNPRTSAKNCSIFPLIAKNFSPTITSIIPGMILMSVLLLSRHHIIEFDPKVLGNHISPSVLTPMDIANASHYDMTTGMTANLWSMEDITPSDTTLRKILEIEQNKWFEVRDVYLFETLYELADHSAPFLQQIIPVFEEVLKQKRETIIHLTALKALTKIVINFSKYASFRTVFPGITPIIVKMYCSSQSQELSEAILRLSGSIGIPSLRAPFFPYNDRNPEYHFAVQSSGFYKKILIDNLVAIFDDPFPALIKATSCVVSIEPEASLCYIEKIIRLYVDNIDTVDQQFNIFIMFSVTIYFFGAHVVPYLDLITTVLLKYYQDPDCLQLMYTMSILLKKEFCKVTRVVYPLVVHSLTKGDKDIFKAKIKFAASAIIYQSESPELLLDRLEELIIKNRSDPLNEIYIPTIYAVFCQLLQYGSMFFVVGRISQFLFTLGYKVVHIHRQLVLNLALFGHVDMWTIRHYCEIDKMLVDDLQIIENMGSKAPKTPKDTRLVRDREPRLFERYFRFDLDKIAIRNPYFFQSIKPPQFHNTFKWIEDLTIMTVANSPIDSIRCCTEVAKHSRTFRKGILPISFLSCWEVASERDKLHISNMVKNALSECSDLDPSILGLVSVLECAGCPIEVDDMLLSKASPSMELSRFYLLRAVKKNPDDIDAIQSLFNLDVKMGLNDSAQALAQNVQSKLSERDQLVWYDKLGQWENVIDYYSKNNLPTCPALIKAYAKLDQWDEVISRRQFIEEASESVKIESAIWFAIAYFRKKDYENADHFITLLDNKNTCEQLLWKTMLYVATKRYTDAQLCIRDCFALLSQIPSNNVVLDTNTTTVNLKYANFLVELEETVNMEKIGKSTLLKIWENRTKNLKTDSSTWLNIFDVRGICIDSSENVEICRKLASSIRKEDRWQILNDSLRRFRSFSDQSSVLISIIKMLWDQGSHRKSIDYITCIINTIESNDSFVTNDEKIDHLIKAVISKGTENPYHSKLLSLKAHWLLNERSTHEEIVEAHNLAKRAVELNPNVPSRYFVYGNALLVLFQQTGNTSYAVESIKALIHCSKTYKKNSDPLMILFHIIFQIGDCEELTDAEMNLIKDLPNEVLFQYRSKFFANIKNKSIKLSTLSRELVSKIAIENYRSVAYELVFSAQDESLLDFIHSLVGSKHKAQFSDTTEFVKALETATNSLCEDSIKMFKSWKDNLLSNTDKVITEIQQYVDCLTDDMKDPDSFSLSAAETDVIEFIHRVNKFTAGGSSRIEILYNAVDKLLNVFETVMSNTTSMAFSSLSKGYRLFSLNIPTPSKPNNLERIPSLRKIDPVVEFLPDHKYSRLISFIDDTGVTNTSILYNRDLRPEIRLINFINGLLNRRPLMEMMQCFFGPLHITPLTYTCGLMDWPAGGHTIHHLVTQYRSMHSLPEEADKVCINEMTSSNYISLNLLQRLEVFEEYKSVNPGNELHDLMWYHQDSPQSWLEHVRNFTYSYAVHSLNWYILGVTNLNPGNMLIEESSGKIGYIDYQTLMQIEKSDPPMRITPMIENAFDGSSAYMSFTIECQSVIRAIRDNYTGFCRRVAMLFTDIQDIVADGNIIEEFKTQSIRRIDSLTEGEIDDVVYNMISASRNPINYLRMPQSWRPLW